MVTESSIFGYRVGAGNGKAGNSVCTWVYGVAEPARGVSWNPYAVYIAGTGERSTRYWECGCGSRGEDIVPRGCTCGHGVREAEGCGRGMQCVGMIIWGRRRSQGRADVVTYEGVGNGLQDS